MKIYAMSDIHGCLDAFLDALTLVPLDEKDVKLILLGDYIHGGYDSYGVVEKIMELKKKYKSRVVVLMGNHENWVIEQGMLIVDEDRDEGEYDDKRENKCINFIQQMELYYKYKNEVLFCHAGVDEEAEDYSVFDTGAVPEIGNADLEDIIKNRSETFQEMLFRIIDRKGLTDSYVYKKANMDRRLFSKIRSRQSILCS